MNIERSRTPQKKYGKRGKEWTDLVDRENEVVSSGVKRRKADRFEPMTADDPPNLKCSTPRSHCVSRPRPDTPTTPGQIDPVSKILRDAGIDPHCGGNDADSEEFFKSSLKKVDNDARTKSYVDEAFEEFDDIYANYSARKLATPKATYSGIDSTTVETPQCLVSLDTPNGPLASPEFLPSEVRIARRRAILEGRNDFREILKRSRIDVGSYFSSVFSAGKSVVGKDNFRCSTPKNDGSSSSPMVIAMSTPNTNDYHIKTPLPLSGVRKLALTPINSNDSAFCPLPVTPASRGGVLTSVTTPYNLTLVSPEKQLPVNLKTSLLSDVICFVDVRTDKENMTESVKQQLTSLGAKVEKNFTRKVTHVIFKEGRTSTYLKAKKHNIPMVSVLWIEACKIALSVVDPKHFPPKQMEKYEDILPFETLKKRRLPKLRTTGNPMGIEDCASSANPKYTRNAVTDAKNVRQTGTNSGIERFCSKKLEFSKFEKQLNTAAVESKEESSDNSTFDSVKCAASLVRRQSAPAKLLSKKKKKKNTKPQYENGDGGKTADENAKGGTESNTQSNACGIASGSSTTSESTSVSENRRKLFNPRFSYFSQQLQSSDAETPMSGSSTNSEYPMPPDELRKGRGVRTKLTSRRMKLKKTTPARRPKRALDALSEIEEVDSFRTCSRRSSISLFVAAKKNDSHTSEKHAPTIVFTRFSSKNLGDLECAVKELGIFVIESNVTSHTSHLVANEPRRTLNMIKAIARGCWILRADWVLKSKEAGKWLNEEEFEMVDFSPAVLHCRLERQAFGPQFCMDLFSNCGGIYISHNTQPPWKELEELVKLCKGRIVTQARAAAIIIRGEKKTSNDSASCPNDNNVVVLSEKWILDCITQNVLLDTAKYISLAT